MTAGELPAYLSYLRSVEPVAFAKAVGDFGLIPHTTWAGSGAALFRTGTRNYTDRVELAVEPGQPPKVLDNEGELDFFRTWHWFYRFVMAGRTVTAYRRRMWDMTRMRLRDIRDSPMGTWSPTARSARCTPRRWPQA